METGKRGTGDSKPENTQDWTVTAFKIGFKN
jgi:hypothetical protein